MAGDLSPEYVLRQLKKGELSPFYLFYGPGEFRLEMVLDSIRETFIPEEARDFNLKIYYADDTNVDPADIIETACSLPFMSYRRLIIVRRTESFSATALQGFIPYLERPVESTCLIFVSSKVDFKRKFYRRVRELGQAVNFRKLNDGQVISWIMNTAKKLGLILSGEAPAYLQQVVGNRLGDLYSELEKLYLRYGRTAIGIVEIRELAIYSRTYTIFELMDEVSFKHRSGSLSVLNRFLEEEDKEGQLRVLGMLNRQIRLLWHAKSIIEGGGKIADVARKIRLPANLSKRVVEQSRCWSDEGLERALHQLYEADGLLKTGSRGHLVLEELVLSLCA